MPSIRSRIVQSIMRDFKKALMADVPIQLRRRQMDEAARRGIRLPHGVSARNLAANGVPGLWLEPLECDPLRTILYLHGGGYVICSADTHRGLAGRVAQSSRSRLLLIDYRLAPEHPFPAALEDSLAAYHWLLDQGLPPEKLVIGGDSAGGGLTLATTLALRQAGEPLPAALFLISPWTDLTFSGDSVRTRAGRDPLLAVRDDWLSRSYAGQKELTDPLISPLFADLHGLPPLYIQVGTEEILFDDSTRLEARALQAGLEVRLDTWEGMWHVFQAYAPYIPESQQAIDRIGEFVRKHVP
jgi:monoterpene epsilon-lactone hydrolase